MLGLGVLARLARHVIDLTCLLRLLPPCLAFDRFCWDTIVDGAILQHGCVSNGTAIAVSVPFDGHVVASVSAVDAAGNPGNPVAVSWIVDTTPPDTSAVITSPTMYVPVLRENAINTTTVTVRVSASETVVAYTVTMTKRGGGALAGGGPTGAPQSWTYGGDAGVLSVPNTLQGDIEMIVTSTDPAGNIDPTPVVLLLFRCVCVRACVFGRC